MSFKKDGRRNHEIDYFSMDINQYIRAQLAVAAPAYSVFINVQANMLARAR